MLEFDFMRLRDEKFRAEFKEDSVREFIISALLKDLGFVIKDSIRQAKLEMQLSLRKKVDYQVGSNKNIKTDISLDYALYVDSKLHCVLDAKAPNVKIDKNSKSFKQVLSYATALNAPLVALCNGLEFRIFSILGQEVILEIDFLAKELDSKYNLLKQILSTPAQSLRQISTNAKTAKKPDSWYLERTLPQAIKNPKKQEKLRYFGCTAYFTRQSWDIVTQNIKNFTDYGDVVLDPFGGSGVTAIESMMNDRIGIHTDLNPLSIFMVKALSAKVNLSEMFELSEEIITEFENIRPKSDKEAKEILKNAKYYPNALSEEFGEIATQKEQDSTLWIPQDEILPKGSDVDSVLRLFSHKQLAELALLRKLIFKKTTPSGNKESRIQQKNMRYSLMLGFYNTITMCNKTYHETWQRPGNAGVCGVYNYYRYRIAPKPNKIDAVETYRRKIQRVIKGKKELENSPVFYDSYFFPTQRVIKDFKNQTLSKREQEDFSKVDSILHKTNGEKIFQADATNLREIESESIDFIYTDPPYGAKIPYLDLSTMWNVWLDLPVDSSLKEKECIEKGSLDKSSDEYQELMTKSLGEMYRVLKYNRWLAFVFQHQDPKLWQTIVESAKDIGFEYVGTVRQSNGQTTFKKRQKPFSVLSGQLIMYFRKIDKVENKAKDKLGFSFDILIECAKDEIMKNNGATLEELHDAMMIKAMNEGFLGELSENYKLIIPAIQQQFDFDEETQKYHFTEIDPHRHFQIPLEIRANYFIISYINRCKKENRPALFDDICLEVIPKLSNGVTPDNKYIKDVLEEIATCDSKTGEWKLKDKKGTQGTLF